MFLLFIALPVLLILILSGVLFRRHIIEIAENQWELTLQRYAAGIEVDLQSMSIIASSLIHNTTLMERSSEYINSKSAEQRYLVSLEIEKLFNTYFRLSRQLVGFHLYFSDEHIPLVFRNYSGIDLSNDETERAIAAAGSRRGFVVFPDNLNFNYGRQLNWYTISLAVSPPDKTHTTGVRTLIVSFVVNSLMDFIRVEGFNTRNTLERGSFGASLLIGSRDAGRDSSVSDSLLFGRDGTVMASSNPEMLGARIEDIKNVYRKSCILISAPVDLTDWIIMKAVNINSLTRSINIILYILYFAVLVIVLFFIWYNTFFFSLILNPLRALMTKMEAVGNGDFSVRVPPGNFIELNRIGESFNFMVEEISVLTCAIKEEQKERLRSEIEALRYQLNPHFLCNTLNAIRMMAIITKNDAIREMSSALMRLTEDTLSREDTVCSLERELHNLDNYIYIMKVRYGDTFEFIKDVDASLLHLGVPSMILQPLVENAILHGFHGLPGGTSSAGEAAGRGQNIIVVSASVTEGVVTIEVKDNGRGMSAEVLAGIFDNEPGTQNGWSRIGLNNVRRRIMLTWGNSYTVRVKSYPGEGTVVIMTLPVQNAGNTSQGDIQNDEYVDH
ncbi:MAG: histidine kinase [Treponema sp.]|jgi:two-component system sensor histidine kinase YesM|nr:histidine kinase [Treponema sp.]